jgi:hypothetical protein
MINGRITDKKLQKISRSFLEIKSKIKRLDLNQTKPFAKLTVAAGCR